ncbi:hypothetical protein [Halomonas sp. M4R1S46]|uniref:hypothetical protein n=1 Tax=Halomonas sp. M4R1S46 TaxID=2982692 RepID=UPI0021E4349F|nr:hypothetical protein [Halomonas sp. M4R1S46]UYG07447.1 hypothetical protein OCT48_17710 [Halomonas sp. M4R1S46]
MQRAWWLCLLVGLAGCQGVPSSLPVAEPPPDPACQWPVDADTPPTTLPRVVAALEDQDFLVRHTSVDLGLVSAERARRTIYHNAVDPGPRLGGFVVGGSGGRVASGVVLGMGVGYASVDEEATEIERVSAVVGPERVQVTRDYRLFDWRGAMRESRTASDEAFCRRLRLAIRRQPAEATP